ncbi:MAG: DUF4349 domain-containing protein [Planctomycetota bacterium]
MTRPNEHTDLETAVREATAWDGEPTELWRSALDAAETMPDHAPRTRRGPKWASAVGLATAAVLVIMIMVVPGVRSERELMVNALAADLPQTPTAVADPVGQALDRLFTDGVRGRVSEDRLSADVAGGGRNGLGLFRVHRDAVTVFDTDSSQPSPPALKTPEIVGPTRQIVQIAALTIETDDIETSYRLAGSLVRIGLGEYVSSGTLRLDPGRENGSLTLRVVPSRLPEVLSDLRRLGAVRDESLRTDDVTDRVIDLGARLTNLRRTEAELLGLLTDRPDSSLSDILRVNVEITNVREQIERLVAQRDELAALVELAAVNITLKQAREPEPEPEPEPKRTLWRTFTQELGAAWRGGIRELLYNITELVRFALGGGLWIGAFIVAGWAIWRVIRSARRKPLTEDA